MYRMFTTAIALLGKKTPTNNPFQNAEFSDPKADLVCSHCILPLRDALSTAKEKLCIPLPTVHEYPVYSSLISSSWHPKKPSQAPACS